MIIYQYNLDTFISDFLAVRDNFTREALTLLFDYYDTFEEPIRFDPIAICCDWTEYRAPSEAMLDICGIEYVDEERPEYFRLGREGYSRAEALESVLGVSVLWNGENCFLVGV